MILVLSGGRQEYRREKGLASEREASTVDDLSVVQVIFSNGFSTAEQVTDFCALGVGMDAIACEARNLGDPPS